MIKSRLADIFRYLSTLRLLAANYNYKMTNMKKGVACLQYYKSPCGEMVLASVDDELCLCDWNDMPCSERNMKRVMRMMRVELKDAVRMLYNGPWGNWMNTSQEAA